MRPILVNIPSKLLFVVALAGALVVFVRELILRRTNKAIPLSSTPLYFVGGAVVLYAKLGDWSFGHPWAPVPIYSYGVMLGTSLVVGWFLAMRFAAEDQHRSAGGRHDLHVDARSGRSSARASSGSSTSSPTPPRNRASRCWISSRFGKGAWSPTAG